MKAALICEVKCRATAQHKVRMEAIATQEDVPVAVIVRRALREYLERRAARP